MMKLIELKDDNSYTLDINRDEAFSIIKSLINQIESNSPNVGRIEHRLANRKLFTITVKEEFE